VSAGDSAGHRVQAVTPGSQAVRTMRASWRGRHASARGWTAGMDSHHVAESPCGRQHADGLGREWARAGDDSILHDAPDLEAGVPEKIPIVRGWKKKRCSGGVMSSHWRRLRRARGPLTFPVVRTTRPAGARTLG
jgi:hypothetical protein